MLGFVVNALAVVVGSVLGLTLKKFIKKEYCDSVIKVVGIGVIIIGILGIIEYSGVITLENLKYNISFNGTLLMIVSLAIGTFIGEILKIDQKFVNLSNNLEKKLNKGNISEGFLTASLLYCIGGMTILGSLNDVLGDPETVYIKSMLDGITSIILASSLGFGVMLSCISVLVIQGSLTLLFYLLGNSFDISSIQELINSVEIVGYAIVIAIGINFFLPEDKKIRVSNMLPALLIPIIYYGVLLCFA